MKVFLNVFTRCADVFIVGLAGYFAGTGAYWASAICAVSFVIGTTISVWPSRRTL